MYACSFCKKNYSEHKGLTVFTFDGKSLHFCSSKCRRNFDLKRDPKKTNWIKREKKKKEQGLKEDKKFQEEAINKVEDEKETKNAEEGKKSEKDSQK